MYLESRYGIDTLNKELIDARKKVIAFARRSERPVVDSLSPLMKLLNANSYQKGGWILHMLRREMGDSLFHLFIEAYYDRYKGKNADTNDLLKVAEEILTQRPASIFPGMALYSRHSPIGDPVEI
jgi:aminopeptidase N